MIPEYTKDPTQEPHRPVTVYFQSGDSSIWPNPGQRNFEGFGWREIKLPDNTHYYFHPTLHITTDVDLRNIAKMEAVTAYLSQRDSGPESVLPPEGWELWLKDASVSKTHFIPGRAWVNHSKHVVYLEKPTTETSGAQAFDESGRTYVSAFYCWY